MYSLTSRSSDPHRNTLLLKRFSCSGPEPGLAAGTFPTGTGPECKLGPAPCSLSLSESTNSSSPGTTSHSVINPLSGNVSQTSQSGRISVRGIKSVCVCPPPPAPLQPPSLAPCSSPSMSCSSSIFASSPYLSSCSRVKGHSAQAAAEVDRNRDAAGGDESDRRDFWV